MLLILQFHAPLLLLMFWSKVPLRLLHSLVPLLLLLMSLMPARLSEIDVPLQSLLLSSLTLPLRLLRRQMPLQ